jgi:hypothetical protein
LSTIIVQLPCVASAKVTKSLEGFHVTLDYDPIRGLGVSGLECKCSYTIRADSGLGENFWLFHSEPKITGIDPHGPAAGILRKGDVIVGIDGLLITTRKAGVRFANIRPGETVELSIRRSGRIREEKITAESVDSEAALEVNGADTALTVKLDELYKAIETLTLHAEDLSMAIDIPNLSGLDVLTNLSTGIPFQDLSNIAATKDHSFLPSGWFGFSLSFSGSITSKKGEDESRWDFDSPPKIREIKDGSPADQAGLRAGDCLTHIDGVKIDSRRGGNLFSSVQPGQEVTWTVRRNSTKFDIKMTAEERPQSREDHGRVDIRGVSMEDIYHDKHFHLTMDRAEIDVEGDDFFEVIEDKAKGEIIIKARGIKIRIRDKNKKSD